MDEAVSFYIRRRLYQYLKVALQPLDMEKDFALSVLPAAAAEVRLGELQVAVRRFDEARVRLEASVRAEPNLAEGHAGLGFLAWVSGEPKRAGQHFQQAIQKGSVDPMVHYHHARVLLRDYLEGTQETIPDPVRDEALKSLARTLEASPEHADAARLYGFLCLFDRARLQQGVSVVESSLKAHPGHTTLLFILGQLYERGGAEAAARTIFQKLLERKLEPSLLSDVRRRLEAIESRVR
jgi:tetratricopeptide (TPR) repeat protein